jgi:hypothetical protein
VEIVAIGLDPIKGAIWLEFASEADRFDFMTNWVESGLVYALLRPTEDPPPALMIKLEDLIGLPVVFTRRRAKGCKPQEG